MFGAQVSLAVGVASVLIAGVIGVLAGIVAGFYGGLVDEVLMRLADLRLALPFILLIIAVIAVLALGCTRWSSSSGSPGGCSMRGSFGPEFL